MAQSPNAGSSRAFENRLDRSVAPSPRPPRDELGAKQLDGAHSAFVLRDFPVPPAGFGASPPLGDDGAAGAGALEPSQIRSPRWIRARADPEADPGVAELSPPLDAPAGFALSGYAGGALVLLAVLPVVRDVEPRAPEYETRTAGYPALRREAAHGARERRHAFADSNTY